MIVIGNGYIGNKVAEHFECEIYNGRIETYEDAQNACAGHDIVFNCAGLADVDLSESDPRKAFDENVTTASLLALTTKYKKLVHFSTGCQVDGDLSDDMRGSDQTIYALTKGISEYTVSRINPNALIIRLRVPFGIDAHHRELITKFRTFNKFHDELQSYTCIEDMLFVIGELINKRANGLYNVANPSYLSPYQIALIMSKYYKDMTIEKYDFSQIKTKVKRVNTRMICKRLENDGIKLRSAKDALIECLEKRKNG